MRFHSRVLYIQFVVDHLGHRMTPQGFDNLLQRRAHVVALVAHHSNAEHGHLPVVLSIDFGHGDVKTVPQPILDAPHHLALVLQAPRLPQEQPHAERTDDHDDECLMTNDESRTNTKSECETGNLTLGVVIGTSSFFRHSSFGLRHSLQGSLHLLDAVRLDSIVHLDVVVAGDLQAALKAFAHLADVFLDALERFQAGGPVRRRINDHPLTNDADLGGALDGPLGNVTAGHGADPADFESLADDGPAQ